MAAQRQTLERKGGRGSPIYLRAYFHNNDGNWAQPLSFTQVREAIGMKCRQNFNQNIRKHPDFQDALIKMNVSECSLNNSERLTHFRLLCSGLESALLVPGGKTGNALP